MHDFTKTDENGIVWHGFGCSGSISAFAPTAAEECFENCKDCAACPYADGHSITSVSEEMQMKARVDCEEETEFESNGLDPWLKELQKILPDGEAFILLSAGYEKLRYASGDVTVVTNQKIGYRCLSGVAMDLARDLLANPNFNTQLEY